MRKWMIIFIICILPGCHPNMVADIGRLIIYLHEKAEKIDSDAAARAKQRKQQAVEQCEMECGSKFVRCFKKAANYQEESLCYEPRRVCLLPCSNLEVEMVEECDPGMESCP